MTGTATTAGGALASKPRFDLGMNRWVRLALMLGIVALAFEGARAAALAILFAGFAVWAFNLWRAGKKHLALTLAAVVVLGLGAFGFAQFELWNRRVWRAHHFGEEVRLAADGVYEGEGQGRRGPVSVELTIAGHRVKDVKVTRHYDTLAVAPRAIDELAARIKGRSDLQVDAVTGATRTSYGIINAARDAAWKGVPEAPELSGFSRFILKVASFNMVVATFHSLGILFIVVLLFDYVLQAALVEGTGQTLNCMDCQTCVGTCPVKTAEGYLFPMGLVLRARLGDYETVMKLARYCVGCARCTAKCPAGISAPSVAAAVARYLHKNKRGEEAAFFEERA